ncbi:MAG: glycosyltransferase family 4 protein [Bacteroidia bacterium]|nr:glycosyltransferase family 4 protein [Bacteroidia bacterium]
MTIAVNTRLLLKDKLEGIGWFTYQLFLRIVRQHPEHTFLFLFDRKWSKEFVFAENVIPVKINPPARHPILWHWWFNVSVPRVLKKYNVDLFVSPDGYLSLNTNVPSLQVIHDLNFEHFPNFVKENHAKYLRKYFPMFARKATRIATVSEFSKNDIIKTYDADEEKVDVIYNAAHKAYKKISNEERETIKNKYSEGNEYFVFVSAFNPRKNITNTLSAFKLFKEYNNTGHKLLMVGEKQYWTKEMQEAYDSCASDVILTGRLNVEELSKVMGSASVLVYASKFEGFGIPIIEAMKCGTPVITSNVSSMPEVALDAAMLVDPNKPDEIANAMSEIISNSTLRNELIEKGLKRSEFFSWDKSAELLWKSMLKILDDGKG